MSGMQYAVVLRQTDGEHAILRQVLAEDRARAAAWIFEVFSDFSLTKAGETEIVVHPLTHPDRIPQAPQIPCGGTRVVAEVIEGAMGAAGACPGCPDCHTGGA